MVAARVAMSGEDDREAKKRARGEDAGGSRPPPRARRGKPPPGIMTAGGMDMARAHASGITVRADQGPAPVVDEPRVVLSVERDVRKVPTGPRLRGGRSPEDERAALLPVAPDAPTIATRTGAPPAPARPRPAWAPLALFAAMLLVGVAVGRRAAQAPEPQTAPPPVAVEPRVVPPAPEPPAPEPPPPASWPEPSPEPPAPIAAAPEPPAAAPPRAPRPSPAKPAFTPPFELPSRKGRP